MGPSPDRLVGPLQRAFTLIVILLALVACHSDDYFVVVESINESGLYTLTSSDLEREYYVSLPANYDPDADALPLLIALHGAGDSIDGWMAGGFQGDGLLNLTAGEAIMVIPNARLNVQDRRIWDPGTETDYIFFLDLLAELDQLITYDERRIFVTGHSAGALMTHELGCRYGDIIRGIAPSAGSITSSITPRCIGSTAVLHMQSEFDSIVPPSVVAGTRDLWLLYNGFDPDAFSDGLTDPCIDYSLGTSAYPMLWCLHDTIESDGHAWWSEADQTIWDFFTGLSIEDPTTDPPPGGGNDNLTVLFPTTLTATIDFPLGLAPVVRSGMFLYPAGSQLPISGAPQQILNGDIDFGVVVPGTQVTFDIPVQLPSDSLLPNDYSLVLAVYVEGGSFPIPTPGVDHNINYELTVTDSTTPIFIPDTLFLEPVLP